MFRRCLTALALVAAFLPIARAADEPVLIEQEPRHLLKFENAHVRFFDVQLEPGYESLSHWHHNDGVFVNIASSPTIAQDWGAEPVARGGRAIGEVYFIGYAAKPKAHRVTNPGPGMYRVTDAEIMSSCGGMDAAREGPNQTLLVDNERVFVTRVILHPGESTELYAPCGMLVSVSGGNVAFDTPDATEKIAMDRAAFKWRKLQQTVKLTNTGSNVFHGVDIRIK
ncbi:MAG TPA: hypothetical protein VJT81_20205 [Burkholderiales bacterium]|nr:hypothetical protein [Burkholderiales bacterium]